MDYTSYHSRTENKLLYWKKGAYTSVYGRTWDLRQHWSYLKEHKRTTHTDNPGELTIQKEVRTRIKNKELVRVPDVQKFIRMVLAGVMADVHENAHGNRSLVNHAFMTNWSASKLQNSSYSLLSYMYHTVCFIGSTWCNIVTYTFPQVVHVKATHLSSITNDHRLFLYWLYRLFLYWLYLYLSNYWPAPNPSRPKAGIPLHCIL